MPTARNTLIYASHSPTCELIALAFDPADGSMRELSRVTIPSTGPQEAGGLGLALGREGKVLYASLRTPPVSMHSYRIDHTSGRLTALGKASLPHRTAFMVPDITGRWLLTVSYPGHVATVSPIDKNGAAGDPVQVLTPPPNPHGIIPHPTNGKVYVSSMVGNQITACDFDAVKGELKMVAGGITPRAGAGAKLAQFNRDGSCLYSLNEYDATVDVFVVDKATGALRTGQSISMLPEDILDPARPLPAARPGIGAGDLQLSPDGRFLIASDRPSNSIASFRIDPQHGTLKPLATVEAEPIPRGFVIDPSGGWILAAGLNTGNVVSYAFDAKTGAMSRKSALRIGDTVDNLVVAGSV